MSKRHNILLVQSRKKWKRAGIQNKDFYIVASLQVAANSYTVVFNEHAILYFWGNFYLLRVLINCELTHTHPHPAKKRLHSPTPLTPSQTKKTHLPTPTHTHPKKGHTHPNPPTPRQKYKLTNIVKREYFSSIYRVLDTCFSFFQLCVDGYDLFLAGCGWVWMFVNFFSARCGWVCDVLIRYFIKF